MKVPIMELFLKEKFELKMQWCCFKKYSKTAKDIDIQHICSNDDSENEAFERLCKQEGMGVEFEYTTPDPPQQNGQFER